MSELKDLAWSVQEQVEPTPFETIHQKGTRRRHRKQLVAVAGVAAATAAAVLVVTLPTSLPKGDNAPPPIITQPTTPIVTQPTTPAPDHSTNPAGEALIRSADAIVERALFATPSSWIATWSDCEPQPCQYAARIQRDGKSVATAVSDSWFDLVQQGDDVYGLITPDQNPLAAADPAWAKSRLASLTGKGLEERRLRMATATSTFGPDEVLVGEGSLRVLNVRTATLRNLTLPADLGEGYSPVQGPKGRWWITATEENGKPWQIAWTDDGGKTWQRHTVSDGGLPGRVAVSHDGRTVAATSRQDGATFEAIGSVVISTDSGVTWRTVQDTPWARMGGPVPFDDGTAALLGIQPESNAKPTGYLIDTDAKARKADGWPKLDDLDGDGKFLYGKTGLTSLAISNDRGDTWRTMTPR